MESLKVMWGRNQSGIDMVMVNEERKREVERGVGSRRYAVGFSMWHAGVWRRVRVYIVCIFFY